MVLSVFWNCEDELGEKGYIDHPQLKNDEAGICRLGLGLALRLLPPVRYHRIIHLSPSKLCIQYSILKGGIELCHCASIYYIHPSSSLNEATIHYRVTRNNTV